MGSRGENCVIKSERAKKDKKINKTAAKANCQDALNDDFVFFLVEERNSL